MVSNEKIILNVGGIKYETKRSTLTKYPDTYLGKIFSENSMSINEVNEYFFDRNGYAFRYVLEYYRTGEILWTPSSESGCCNGVNIKEMTLEFDFFKIPNDLDKDYDKEYDLEEVRELFRELSDTTFPSTTSKTLNTESLSTNNPSPNNYGIESGGGKFGTTESLHSQYQYPPPPLPSKFGTSETQVTPYALPPSKFGTNESQVFQHPTRQYTAVTPYSPNINYSPRETDRIRRWTTPEEHAQILDSFVMALSDVIYDIHHNLRGQINIQFHSRSHQNQPSIEFDLDLDSVKEIMKPFRASGYKLLEWYGNEIEKKLKRDFNVTISIVKSSQKANTFLLTITLMPFNNKLIHDNSSLNR